MYLKRVELHGFKSFAGKTIMEFHPGITSVVGPNGSGKSNIADAVKWVLGEQSAKELRGTRMMDVIFSGTEFRRKVGHAEVTLIIDNRSRHLPLEYEEVAITRRLYRSGDSECFINHSPCRLKDIHDLFLDTGVGREGYSIIGQGKIHEILSVKSEDRRSVFDEAAGIMKYRVKKTEAGRKLEKTEENLLRLRDIMGEIQNQLEPLRIQSEKAKEYLILRDKLKELEVGLYLNTLNGLKQRETRFEEEIGDHRHAVVKLEECLDQIHRDIQTKKEALKSVERAEEIARNQLNEFLLQVETTQHEISLLAEKISGVEERMVRILQDLQDLDERNRDIGKETTEQKERLEYLREQHNLFTQRMEECRRTLEDQTATMDLEEQKIQEMRNQTAKKGEELSEWKLECRTLQNGKIELEERLTQAGKRITHLVSEKDGIAIRKQDGQSQARNLEREKGVLEEQFDRSEEIHEKLQEKLNLAKQERIGMETRLGIVLCNRDILTDMVNRLEGFGDSVKWILSEQKNGTGRCRGVMNVLGRVLETDEKYEKAMEAALDDWLQAIITENEVAAEEAMECLKQARKGRACFFPLDWIQENAVPLPEVTENMEGYLGRGIDKVRGMEPYRSIFQGLLRKVLLADNYRNAVKIWKSARKAYTVVTLDGEVIGREGWVLGGTIPGEAGILGRERKLTALREEEEQLRVGIHSILLKEQDWETECSSIRKQTRQVQDRIREIHAIQVKISAQLEVLERDSHRVQKELNHVHGETETLSGRRSENDVRIGKISEKIQISEAELNHLRHLVSEHERSCQEGRIRKNRTAETLSDLRVSLLSVEETMKNTSGAMENMIRKKAELLEKRRVREAETESLNECKRKLEEEITGKSRLVEHPEEIKQSLKNQVEILSEERRDIGRKLDEDVEGISTVNREIIQLQDRMGKVEANKARVTAETEALKDRMWEEYGLTHNEAMRRHGEIQQIEQAKRDIRECRNGILAIGDVNINAIEDYTKTRERYFFMEQQAKDLMASKEDLYRVIGEMDQRMKEIFLQKFMMINETFNTIFRALFEGGTARVELCDASNVLESGIDIIAQPPGKKLQNMMLLSVGEKAFTAIALLFAILQVNPSPFCIFDEIEAALDDSNVIRFAEYLTEYKEQTQFIMITHQKATMEYSDSIYGVTMQEHGISKVVSMKMNHRER